MSNTGRSGINYGRNKITKTQFEITKHGKTTRYVFPMMAILLLILSCTSRPDIEPCAPDDEEVLVNSVGETVTEVELFNWAVLAEPAGEEVLEFWTGNFRIECVRHIEGHRPWTRLIDDNKSKAGWTAP